MWLLLVTRNGELTTEEEEPYGMSEREYIPACTAGMENDIVGMVPVELD